MKKVLIVFGTRPEAIKLCPLIIELKKRISIETVVCVTAQHRQMLDQVLDFFKIIPDYDLNIMKNKQTLFDITSSILNDIRLVLEKEMPDLVIIHGDTTTAFSTALASFYLQIPIGHVEAGLRTHNIYSPFPEEFNRKAISLISNYNFAPTFLSYQNLINEGCDSSHIYITGNTVIDSLKYTVDSAYSHPELDWAADSKLIFLTAHRRENMGKPMESMFKAIKRVLDEHEECKVVYPIHLNPYIRRVAFDILGDSKQIHIIEPLSVIDCHNFEARSYLCLTDSGGIQEECPSYGVPVLVMRETTERPEGVSAGVLKLVGTEEDNIYQSFKTLLEDDSKYREMSNACSPFGDGYACERIADIIEGKEYIPWNYNKYSGIMQ